MRVFCLSLLITAAALLPRSAIAELGAPLPAPGITRAEVAGTATVRWLGFRVLDAELFTPRGAAYDPKGSAALRLQYSMDFTRDMLLRATMFELRRLEGTQPDHPTLRQKLATCYADVGKDDSFLAIGPAEDKIELFRNATRTCRVTHPNIRERFLNIWLSPDSRFPSLSRQLRGS